jgi:hypothetical protein
MACMIRPRFISPSGNSTNVTCVYTAARASHYAHPSTPIGACSAAQAAHAIASTRSSCRPSRVPEQLTPFQLIKTPLPIVAP